MNPYKILAIFCLVFTIYTVDLECNNGVPILIRIPKGQNQYTVKYHCLCPQNYYSYNCAIHRKISCILTAEQPQIKIFNVPAVNEKGQTQLKFQFTQDCYKKGDSIDTKSDQSNKNKLSTYQLAKNMNLKAYVEWRNQNAHTNVYTGDGFEIKPFKVLNNDYDTYFANFSYEDSDPFKNGIQILWVNDTKMFDKKGVLKMSAPESNNGQESKQSPKDFFFRQHKQLEMYPPYDGFVSQNLMGYQMVNQQLVYYFKGVKLWGKDANTQLKIKEMKHQSSSRLLQSGIPKIPDFKDFNFDQSKIPVQRKIEGQKLSFTSLLNLQQLNQNDIVRTQFSVYLKSKDSQFIQKISLKDAFWDIILQYNEQNQTKYDEIYNAKLSQGYFVVNVWTILVTCLFGAGLLICFGVFCYKFRKDTMAKDYKNYEDQG